MRSQLYPTIKTQTWLGGHIGSASVIPKTEIQFQDKGAGAASRSAELSDYRRRDAVQIVHQARVEHIDKYFGYRDSD